MNEENKIITCFRCGCEITSANQTVEHIIPMACAGRLKSKKLLCRKCNSFFGEKFDSELAEQTNDLVNLLLIKREKGTPPPIKAHTSTGEDYRIYGGKVEKAHPEFKLDKAANKLSVEANNDEKMRLLLKQLKRRIPTIDVDEILNGATRQKSYMQEHLIINSKVGGNGVFKSITKISIEYFLLKRGDKKFVKHLIPYLDGTAEQEIVWMHYPDEAIYDPEITEVSNIIRLIGNPQEKILYAYIELFNVHNFIVKLNDEYDGFKMDETYIFDLLGIKEVVKHIFGKRFFSRMIVCFANLYTASYQMSQ